MKENFYIKTNRSFNIIRDYGWIITLLIAIGGLFQPKLGLLVLFIMVGLSFFGFLNGRWWCGNVCPHGSLFDRIFLPISKNKSIPKLFKNKKVILGFFIFFMFNFSKKMINVFSYWGDFNFLDKLGLLFSNTYLMVFTVGGLMAVFINPRTWCQFCPMGSMQKAVYKIGSMTKLNKNIERKLIISDKNACYNCGKCEKVCPFQLSPQKEFNEINQFDDINCIKCSTCIENCPAKILSFKTTDEAKKIVENLKNITD